MTSCLLSVALLLTSPVAPTPSSVGVEEFSPPVVSTTPARLDFYNVWRDEGLWVPSPPIAIVAASAPPTSLSLTESSSALIASPALSESPPPQPVAATPAPVLTPIERALNRLSELGASPYQLRIFGCLAWFESSNNPYAIHYNTNGSVDRSLWQINSIHAAKYAGRDIFDPVVNAEVAWQVYQSSGWRAWVVAPRCGV